MRKNKRILIFNVNWIGDVLFSTPSIRNIRRNYPDSYIACIVPSRCYHVLKDNPYLDEIIIFDEKDRHRSVLSKFSFISMLRDKQFDTAILLHGSFTRALICKLAGIPERIGYATKKRSALLTKKIPVVDHQSMHRIDYYLNIIIKAGLRAEDRFLDFFFNEEDAAYAEDFLLKHKIAKNDLLIGINAGGNWPPKRWPPGYWAGLIDKVVQELGAKVVIAGGQHDLGLVKQISSGMKAKAIIACGNFNLKQSAALFKKLDLFISADTGPMHIANAVGAKRIIAIFGPTDPSITGPFPLKNVLVLQKDIGCKIPCYAVDCKDNRCMKAVTVEEVFRAAKEFLKNG